MDICASSYLFCSIWQLCPDRHVAKGLGARSMLMRKRPTANNQNLNTLQGYKAIVACVFRKSRTIDAGIPDQLA